ncbi:DUF3047 domain-containing protein [Neomegalonema sp.]|uniref:DUF3047 domain-containing protein n=1 Tax=Neomegalonema sp. TaxID=2039713 RepID=UPI002619AEEB|nr:DUF3047 domain-containing protein [Neomegalonema sp.]MDD2869237.1 DUF3047 domain-containing protein [Neomegalonema sp.]
MPCALHGIHLSRRSALLGLGAAGLASGLGGLANPAAARLFADGDFTAAIRSAYDRAGGAALGRIAPFTITGSTRPWETKLPEVKAGQQVTFLLSGRWHLLRELDLWFEPGVVFHARVSGGAMYNPSLNFGTMTADGDGPIEIARSASEWANEQGDLWGPLDAYLAADGRIEGVAILWDVDPREGLALMKAQGDAAGILAQAHERAVFPHVTPEGWFNHFNFGEGGVFRSGEGEMNCRTHKQVAILRRDVNLDLTEDLRLDWDWIVEELPSLVAEDQIPSHDYLSIAVEYDDGQDLTYMWSAAIPQGTVFRCPLPGWNMIETHLVQRSGRADLGKWLSESRNLAQDYREIIGGPATKALRVWLLGVSTFQRRTGACRYRGVSIGGAAEETRLRLV